jgi:anti-anti-sigma regulatory factor
MHPFTGFYPHMLIMQVKIDTKEKFHVITFMEDVLSANMTGDLEKLLSEFSQAPVKNMVLNFSHVKDMEIAFGGMLTLLQQKAYEQDHSMVFCCLNKQIEEKLDKAELLEIMNTTPTESEAYDIVQMEEIERDFLSGE